MAELIFKLCTSAEWSAAEAAGSYDGSDLDKNDGFIHLSSAATVKQTAALYFADLPDVVLVAVDPDKIENPLKWEESRGGALFPHVYGPLNLDAVVWVKPLPWNAAAAAHEFPEIT